LGVSKEQVVENRRAIVAAAAKLFRERGVDGRRRCRPDESGWVHAGGLLQPLQVEGGPLLRKLSHRKMSNGTAGVVKTLQETVPKAGGAP